MELDSISAHGASSFLVDRLMINSDKFVASICDVCGNFAIPKCHAPNARLQTKAYCNTCKTGDNVRDKTIPYSFKLLAQEAAALNIAIRIKL